MNLFDIFSGVMSVNLFGAMYFYIDRLHAMSQLKGHAHT
jgi:hypothetical protein